jgi:hypothetical protein
MLRQQLRKEANADSDLLKKLIAQEQDREWERQRLLAEQRRKQKAEEKEDIKRELSDMNFQDQFSESLRTHENMLAKQHAEKLREEQRLKLGTLLAQKEQARAKVFVVLPKLLYSCQQFSIHLTWQLPEETGRGAMQETSSKAATPSRRKS